MITLKHNSKEELHRMLADVLLARIAINEENPTRRGLDTLKEMLNEELSRRDGIPVEQEICADHSIRDLLISAHHSFNNAEAFAEDETARAMCLDLMFSTLHFMLIETVLSRIPEEERNGWDLDNALKAYKMPGCGMCDPCLEREALMERVFTDLKDHAVEELHINRLIGLQPVAEA